MNHNENTCFGFLEFLQQQSQFKDDDEFMVNFAHFLQSKFSLDLELYRHFYQPQPFKLLYSTNVSHSVLKQFQANIHLNNFMINTIFELNGNLIFPLGDSNNNIKYIFVFTEIVRRDFAFVENLLNEFQTFVNFLWSCKTFEIQQINEKNANLISQLSHDFNSLISIIKKNNKLNNELAMRIRHSEQMTKNILFVIRDLELIPSSINLQEFFSAVRENWSIPETIELEISVSSELPSIQIDVELLAIAFNEIIDNSLHAIYPQKGKIQLHVSLKPKNSIFINSDWIEITVIDDGYGIPQDFLPFVKNPFFTTLKSQGHCGLGLSLADKIIQAHGGYFDIRNNKVQGVVAQIYLPEK